MRTRLRSRAAAVVTVGLLAACGQEPGTAPEPGAAEGADESDAATEPDSVPGPEAAGEPEPEAAGEPEPEAAGEPEALESAGEPDADDGDDHEPDDTVQPVGTPGGDPVATEDFPSLEGEQALLTDVRVGTHEGFDRVVFEFLDEVTPGYQVGYVDPPIVEDASGREIDVAGDAFLEVRMTPATGVDIDGPEPERIYEGPDRLEPAAAVAVTQVVRIGDHHADLGWVVGVEQRAPFAVSVLDDPARLVVDVIPATSSR